MSRKPLIAGNWKMNLNHFEAIALVQKIAFSLPDKYFDKVDVAVIPPFTDLRSVQTLVDGDKLLLARLTGGSLFGEMALLSRAPRAASVVARRPSILLVGRKDALDAVAERESEVAPRLRLVVFAHEPGDVNARNAVGGRPPRGRDLPVAAIDESHLNEHQTLGLRLR